MPDAVTSIVRAVFSGRPDSQQRIPKIAPQHLQLALKLAVAAEQDGPGPLRTLVHDDKAVVVGLGRFLRREEMVGEHVVFLWGGVERKTGAFFAGPRWNGRSREVTKAMV